MGRRTPSQPSMSPFSADDRSSMADLTRLLDSPRPPLPGERQDTLPYQTEWEPVGLQPGNFPQNAYLQGPAALEPCMQLSALAL